MKLFLTTALVLGAVLTMPARAELVEGKEVPSIKEMKDPHTPYGLNLEKVGERVKVLRPLGVSNDASYTVSLYQGNLGKKNLIEVTLPKLKADLARLGKQMESLNDELMKLEKERKSSLLTRIKSKFSANPKVAEVQMQLDSFKAAEEILKKDIGYIEGQAAMLPAIDQTLGDAMGKLKHLFGLTTAQVKALPPTPVKLPSGQME